MSLLGRTVAGVLIGLVVAEASPRQGATNQTQRPELVWAEPSTDISGAISRDGHFIPYVDWSTGNLALRDLHTGVSRTLTKDASLNDSTYAQTAILSPDRRRVAYQWVSPQGLELRVMDVDSSKLEALASDTELFAWTADAAELLVSRNANPVNVGTLGFMRVADRSFRPVGKAGRLPEADLAPDSSRIILSELREADPARRHIRLIDVASGSSTVLSTDSDDYSPRWTPDGLGVVFLSDRGKKPGIWYLPLGRNGRTGTPQSLADAPDARLRILGITAGGTVYVGTEDVGGQQAYVARVDWTSGQVRNATELVTPPFTGARRAVF